MLQRTLGINGPAVGAIGVGVMPLSLSSNRPSQAEALRILTVAAERGMTLWDTADAYAADDSEFGHNELLVATAYRQLPAELKSQVIVATKGGHTRTGREWTLDGRPEYLKEAFQQSLKRLGVEQIDLYQYHRPDPKVPFDESVGAIAEIYHSGSAKHVGLSNVTTEMMDVALKVMPVTSVQNQYSPIHLAPESDGVLAKCQEHGIAFLPYSPLGGSGGAKGIGQTGALAEVAKEVKVSSQRVVLAWLLSKYLYMIPIPGVSRIESVEDSAQADNVCLSDNQIKRLEESWGGTN
jgi:aryl-alcohol dehydrogenase-like predicted oxidoreductase